MHGYLLSSSLSQTDNREGQGQKIYADTYAKFLLSATILLLDCISRIVIVWKTLEFVVTVAEDDFQVWKNAVLNMVRSATRVLGTG